MDSSGTKLKITDFGSSKDFKKQQMNSIIGTETYLAPEILMGIPVSPGHVLSYTWLIGVRKALCFQS